MTGPNPLVLALVFGLLTLVPSVLLLGTSFVKCSVVLGVLKNAFGGVDVPGNLAVLGLSLVLSMHVMAPTAEAVWAGARVPLTAAVSVDPFSAAGMTRMGEAWDVGKAPLVRFLRDNSNPRDRALFVELRRESARRQGHTVAQVEEDVTVLLPAFAVSELTRALVMAFLVLLPFLVLDLVVAHGLAAMGLPTLSPATVALPFKLVLFVSADGWHVLARALVLGYR